MDAGATKPTRTFRIATAGGVSRPAAAIACIVLLVLVLLPVFAGRNLIQDLIFLFYMLALAQCWNLLAGYAGLISVGQQAFVGLGGYLLFALTLAWRHQPAACDSDRGHRFGGAGLADRADRVPPARRLFCDRHLGRGRGLSAGLRASSRRSAAAPERRSIPPSPRPCRASNGSRRCSMCARRPRATSPPTGWRWR